MKSDDDKLTIIAIGFYVIFIILIIYGCATIGEKSNTIDDILETSTEASINSTQEPPPSPEPKPIYDVPLDESLQIYIFQECDKHNIDPAVVIAMIWRESSYNSDAVGDNGNSIGLMQIQERFHHERMTKLGCTDLYNPYDNVTVGIDILSELIAKYDDNVEMALMAYNAGSTGAYRNWFSQGIYTNSYSQSVLNKAQELYFIER